MTVDRILITRPEKQAEGFAARLSERFGPDTAVILAPLMRIEATGEVPDLEGIRGLIFTSGNGVDAFVALFDIRRLPVHCVGQATAARAADAGFDVVSIADTADDLVAELSTTLPPGPLLHLAGRNRRGRVAERLTSIGLKTQVAEIYDQVELPMSSPGREALAMPGPLLLPVFSPRSASLLKPYLSGAVAELRIASISPAATSILEGQFPCMIDTAVRPDAAAVLDALERLRDP